MSTPHKKHPITQLLDFLLSPLDAWLSVAMLLIYVMSLFLLYSADGENFAQLENKTIHTIVGLLLLWIIAKIKPLYLSNFALPLYLVSLVLLLGVHFFGITVNGSTRWLDLGLARVQPSEFIKIALPMLVAWYFQKYELNRRWYHYFTALLIIFLPVWLIVKQPDLGTAILIMASGLFVIFFAGLPWRVIIATLVGFAAIIPLYWQYLMEGYQKKRVFTLFNPQDDPLGAGYHIIQSMTAIGSGGIWGKGWLKGTQTHLGYIPEQTTDFIFSVYAEEFGLLGNMLLLLIYILIIGRGLWISANARTLYGRLLAAALSMIFFCYVFVNLGMVSGILPVVGVPLPLVSYGGTSTLSIMVILAMLMGIAGDIKK